MLFRWIRHCGTVAEVFFSRGFVSANGGSAFGRKKVTVALCIVHREVVVICRVNTEKEAGIRNRYVADPSIKLRVSIEQSRSADRQDAYANPNRSQDVVKLV